MDIVRVAAVGHSGTTFFERLLASNVGVLGAGEVERTAAAMDKPSFRQRRCSCGAQIADCPIWGAFDSPVTDPAILSASLTARAKEDGFTHLVDSSKRSTGMRGYYDAKDRGVIDRIVILRLIRDPRGWANSMGREKLSELDAHRLLYRWLIENLSHDRKYAKQPHVEIVNAWYDKTVLGNVDETLKAVSPQFSFDESRLNDATQHVIEGSRSAFKPMRGRLSYDPAWLNNRLVQHAFAELPLVQDYYFATQELHLKSGAPKWVGVNDATEFHKVIDGARTFAELRRLDPDIARRMKEAA